MSAESTPIVNSAANAAADSASTALLGNVIGKVKDTWDSSKGSEVLSKLTDTVPQETKDNLKALGERFLNPALIRSPKLFFGFGEEKAFFIEKDPPVLASRVKHNIKYFYMNYLILTAILFFLTLIVSPGAILGLGLLAVLWVAVIRATSSGSVTIKGFTISQKNATIAMSILSFLILLKILSNVFWWTLGTSSIVVVAHSLFRDSSMLRDEEDKVDMTGDLGEDASFLNQETA